MAETSHFVLFHPQDDTDFKNILDFPAAYESDCGLALKRLLVLQYKVDFILLSFGILNSILELLNH